MPGGNGLGGDGLMNEDLAGVRFAASLRGVAAALAWQSFGRSGFNQSAEQAAQADGCRLWTAGGTYNKNPTLLAEFPLCQSAGTAFLYEHCPFPCPIRIPHS